MNANLQIQKLLAFSEEFEEFQELDVIIESPFILIKDGYEELMQVFVGLSSDNLLFANQKLLDYKKHPEVIHGSFVSDLDLEGLELLQIIPLSKVTIRCHEAYRMTITSPHKPVIHLELCNNRLSKKGKQTVWCAWVDLIHKLEVGIPLSASAKEGRDEGSIHWSEKNSSLIAGVNVDSKFEKGIWQLLQLTRSCNSTNEYHNRFYLNKQANKQDRYEEYRSNRKTFDNSSEIVRTPTYKVEPHINTNNGANIQHELEKSTTISNAKQNTSTRSCSQQDSGKYQDVARVRNRTVLHNYYLNTPSGEEKMMRSLYDPNMWRRVGFKSSGILVNTDGTETFTDECRQNPRKTSEESGEQDIRNICKTRSRKKVFKTTRQIMAEKFGLDDLHGISTKEAFIDKMSINSASSSTLNAISMSLTEHPDYSNELEENTPSSVHDHLVPSPRSAQKESDSSTNVMPYKGGTRKEDRNYPAISLSAGDGDKVSQSEKATGNILVESSTAGVRSFGVIPHSIALYNPQMRMYVDTSTLMSEGNPHMNEEGSSIYPNSSSVERQAFPHTVHPSYSQSNPSYSTSDALQPRSGSPGRTSQTLSPITSITELDEYRVYNSRPSMPDCMNRHMLLRNNLCMPQESIPPLTHGNADEQTQKRDKLYCNVYSVCTPSWLSRYLSRKKTIYSTVNKQVLDGTGKPLWLTKKQKYIFDQLIILKTLEDELDFVIYTCDLHVRGDNPLGFLNTHNNILLVSALDDIVCEIRKAIDCKAFPPASAPTNLKKTKFDILKIFKRQLKGMSDEASTFSKIASSLTTEKVLEALMGLYPSCNQQTHGRLFKMCDPDELLSAENQLASCTRWTCATGSNDIVSDDDGIQQSAVDVSSVLLDLSSTQSFAYLSTSKRYGRLKQPIPPSIIQAAVCHPLSEGCGSVYESFILHHPAREIARELTLINRSLITKIDFDELVKNISNFRDEVKLSVQPVLAMLMIMQRIQRLLTTEVVRCRDVRTQVAAIRHLISVMNFCWKHSDYGALFLVLDSLSSHSIQRLHDHWTQIEENHPAIYKVYKRCRDMVEDRVRYMKCLKKSTKQMEHKGFIPSIIIYLQDVWQCVTNLPLPDYKSDDNYLRVSTSSDLQTKLIESALNKEIVNLNGNTSNYCKFINLLTTESPSAIREITASVKAHRVQLDSLRKQLLVYQMASIHYDFESNSTLRNQLLTSVYDCKVKSYITSLLLREISVNYE